MNILNFEYIKNNVIDNLKLEIDKVSDKISNPLMFISDFNNNDLSKLKGYCFSLGINPYSFMKNYYYSNLSELKNNIVNQLNVSDAILTPNYDTGNLKVVLIYENYSILELNLLDKTYIILEDKDFVEEKELLYEKLTYLKKDVSFFEEILFDEKKLKDYYSINKLGILSFMNIKSKQKALSDANHKYKHLKKDMEETITKINLLLKKSNAKTNFLERTIKKLKDLKYIEFNSLKKAEY